jgi:hypothetical protein
VKRLAFICLSVAALLAVGPSASAEGAPVRQFEFKLREDGFKVTVKDDPGEEKVLMTLFRDGEVAYYETPAEVGEDSVRARFGQLGELDYTFTPAPRARSCGKPTRGTFEGTFNFTGENEYVKFAVAKALGRFDGPATDGCEEAGRRPAAFRARGGGPKTEGADDEATLGAHTRLPLPARSLLVFEFVRKGRSMVAFDAFQQEKKEGMRVARGAAAVGPRSTFIWNLEAGTAHLDPPAPFTGTATYKRRPKGRPVWRGSLAAPVPGGAPIRLTGDEFVVQLIKGSIVD